MSPLASASAFCVLALNVQAIGLNIVHAQHGYRRGESRDFVPYSARAFTPPTIGKNLLPPATG
jgi:hypothetical protein